MRSPSVSLVSLCFTLAALGACAGPDLSAVTACPGPDCPGCPGPGCTPQALGKADGSDYNDLNLAAGTMVLYEVQARTANACRTDLGSASQQDACGRKVAPHVTYRAQGMSCGAFADLSQIRLGTLDDMLEDTADQRAGITLRYVAEKVGATTVWLMPLFPNNDTWSIPDPCDNLGSPYAVRDYWHVSGSLARECIRQGRDERSTPTCYGNGTLDTLIGQAHGRGLKVMLDVALNHFGHNYQMSDAVDFRPVRERIASNEDLDGLSDFAATDEPSLVHPDILDTEDKLRAAAASNDLARRDLQALSGRCPALVGDALVRAFNVWRVALDWERAQFPCDTQYLEYAAPGFYLGSDRWSPSRGAGDNFSGDGTNTWPDVKFLYHRADNVAHHDEFVRNREYLFRVLNYWASRGVDGFRLDHTTDPFSGLAPGEWDYIVSKVDYYNWRRGQARPVYLAEEFADQQGMNRVVDVMTEGYVRDMDARGGQTKDTAHVEGIIDNMGRFDDHAYVMTALETHDEVRLTDGTGFNVWTGAGFWGIGATTRSTPMLLMGQELGESAQLQFRKSDLLRSRFDASPQIDLLRDYYRTLVTGRLDPANRALYSGGYQFLRTRTGHDADARIFAQARWSGDGSVVFVVHNLWEQSVAQSYTIPAALADTLWLRSTKSYRLVDIISGRQMGGCRSGADLAADFYVALDADTRAQWLRLELCE